MNRIAEFAQDPSVLRHETTFPREPLPLPQLVTPEEVAEYLGVSAYTVRERLKSGELPGRKHGSRWLIRVVDLVTYVQPNNLD